MKAVGIFLAIFLFAIGCGFFLCIASGYEWGTRDFGRTVSFFMIPGAIFGAIAAVRMEGSL